MRRSIALLGIAAIAACSSLPNAGGGVVALEVRTPDTLGGLPCSSAIACTLARGASLTLRARALNLQGDSVAADIVWITPDTTLITLDALRGVVKAISDTGGTARVQASVGTLRSDVILITVRRDSAVTTGLHGQR